MTAKTELSSLEASGLIRLAALSPDIEYLFRHALVQDAAYSSLPKQERRALHARAAEVLLSLYPQRERELGAVLGMHLEHAGDTAGAARHFVDAGEHALERFANQEAGAFFDRAYRHLPGDARDGATLELRLRAAIGSAKAAWTFVPADTPLDRLHEVLGVADGTGGPRLLADAHFWVVFLHRARGDTAASSPELQRSLDRLSEIGDTLGDPAARAIPQAFMGIGLATTGHLRAGAEILEKALDVMEEGSDPLSAALLADVLTMTYARLGEFAAAERAIGRSERLAERGDAIARLDSTVARSNIALERGDVAESAALSSKCAADAEALGAVACAIFSNLIHGEARLELDQPSAARPPLERVNELSVMANMPQARTLAQGWLTSVAARMRELPSDPGGWAAALEVAQQVGDPVQEATIYRQRALGLAAGASPDWRAIQEDLERAAALFEASEARPALARTLRDEARALDALGRPVDATAARERAGELARAIGLRDGSSA